MGAHPPQATGPVGRGRFDRPFWLYLAAVGLIGAGFADFTLMAYHFQRAAVIGRAWTPVFYAIAMAVSGAGSLLFGRMFDRIGLMVLVPVTIASSFFAPLVFYGSFGPALLGTALWGLGTGVHESVMAAAVAVVVPVQRRGSAYGLFNAVYGGSWFLGSWLMGVLYGAWRPGLVLFAMATQLAAVPLFARLAGSYPGRQPPPAEDAVRPGE
ncbi:MAG: MFS transporter [Acidimicrobiales bacterium]